MPAGRYYRVGRIKARKLADLGLIPTVDDGKRRHVLVRQLEQMLSGGTKVPSGGTDIPPEAA